MNDLFNRSAAIISSCGLYRYALTRKWGDGPTMMFLMLNPSTADAQVDDPTIRRCLGFANREKCSGIRVENLFAYRATKPDEMFDSQVDPVGDTDLFIRQAVAECTGPIIAAWGADPRAKERAQAVLTLLGSLGRPVFCLGRTASGAPRHPLYVHGDTPLEAYR